MSGRAAATESEYRRLPRTGRVARDTLWNLVGMSLPMAVALFAIPALIRGLGNERFGLLGLVWMLVGYFSIFDLGLGRALTRLVAERLGQGRDDEVPALFWTSMLIMTGIGCAGAVALAAAAPALVGHVFKVDPACRGEAVAAFRIVGLGLPVTIANVGLVGMLEAHRRFGLINLIRVPMGTLTFLGPLCTLPFSATLPAVVAVLVTGRYLEWLLYVAGCLRAAPACRAGLCFRRALVRPMLGFGGWMTISNIAMPVMVHIDRFLIGSVLAVSQVAFYVTPAEIVVKLLILPRALVSVLFPSFAAHLRSDRRKTAALYERSVKWLLAGTFPVVLAVVALARPGLRLWLDETYARQSAPVMQFLAAGLFIYALAYVPFSCIQGGGRPALTAAVHLVELPLYLLLAPPMIRRFGITGAAAAWFVRVNIETVVLFALAHRFVPESRRGVVRALLFAAAGLLILFGAARLAALPWRLLYSAAAGLLFLAASWFGLLDAREREAALALAAKVRRRPGRGADGAPA